MALRKGLVLDEAGYGYANTACRFAHSNPKAWQYLNAGQLEDARLSVPFCFAISSKVG
jgi:hypothetical protein